MGGIFEILVSVVYCGDTEGTFLLYIWAWRFETEIALTGNSHRKRIPG
jgi:hypothetical protein